MSDQQENIITALRELGGVSEWNPLKEKIAQRDHRNMLKDVRALRDMGKLTRQVKRDDASGRVIMTMHLVQ